MNRATKTRRVIKFQTVFRQIVSALLLPSMLLVGQPIGVASAKPTPVNLSGEMPPPVLTPRNVKVNRTLPIEEKDATPRTKGNVTTNDIFRNRVFIEPLVPIDGVPSAKENRAIMNALDKFAARTKSDDASAAESFIADYPDSVWNLSLLSNLGDFYYRTGQYSEALSALQKAWEIGKGLEDQTGKIVADQVLGRLAMMRSKIGEAEELDSLLGEAGSRQVVGSASEAVANAKENRWRMFKDPGTAFHCGPLALASIRRAKNMPDAYDKLLTAPKKTGRGFKMSEVGQLAASLGMNYEAVRREGNAELTDQMLPAVVHWKVNHYASVLKKSGDKYLLKDQTFGAEKTWISSDVLVRESSGYFLVPKGTSGKGWNKVSSTETASILGKGAPNGKKPGPCPGTGGGDGGGCGMIGYTFELMTVSLTLRDTPVFYTPPVGPQPNFGVNYRQRDFNQPAIFDFSNFGPKWSGMMTAFVEDDPTTPAADVKIYDHGDNVDYSDFDTVTQQYGPQIKSRDVLKRTSTTPIQYERKLPDGSRQVFAFSNGSTTPGRRVFLTEAYDPQGNKLTLHYDSLHRLSAVEDATGEISVYEYANASSPYLITKITDPFGRFAVFHYNGNGYLDAITDVIGMQSSVTYGSGDFVDSITTPYGTTKFAFGEKGAERWLESTDPYGDKERVEFRNYDVANNDRNVPIPDTESVAPTGISGPTLTNNYLNERNTFFWDKKAMKMSPGNYSKARLIHWLHADENFNIVSDIPESTKEAYEGRVWFTYPNQIDSNATNNGMIAQPKIIARVLSDGTTQKYQAAYNDFGLVTNHSDPEGRTFTNIYETNDIDLKEVRQTRAGANELLKSATYNSAHLPLTVTDAAGQTTIYTYTTRGQLETVTNPKGEVTTFAHDAVGRLESITGDEPGAVTSYTYDGYNRVRTKTDSDGHVLTYDYDALDRVTKVTYPDGTYEQVTYDRLNQGAARDRQGRITHYYNNALRQIVAVKDASGRTINYEWCRCGKLQGLTDAKGQITRWKYNERGQNVEKRYNDGTIIQYTYDNANRMATRMDPLGQVTTYAYFRDDNLKSRTYTSTVNATPNVSFTYDPDYDRIKSISDGSGTGSGVTTYDYHAVAAGLGAGSLSEINGSLSSDVIALSYDELGRPSQRTVNGNAMNITYDNLGRLTGVVNALGTFGYGYVAETGRLDTVSYPNGQSIQYDYYPNTSALSGAGNGDRRLKQIKNLSGTTLLSRFNYAYEPDGSIREWDKTVGTAAPIETIYRYDATDRLLEATFNQSGAITQQFGYGYDAADNRTTERVDGTVTSASHNAVNELQATTGAGAVSFNGGTNEEASVTVGGQAALEIQSGTRFEKSVSLVSGSQTVNITATDPSGNAKSQNYNVTVTSGPSQTFIYDADGNLTDDGDRQYAWDAENRLVKITEGTKTSIFEYDGFYRRVRILEKNGTTTLSDKRFVWFGSQLVEQRDAANTTAVQRYFAEGVQQGSNKYFYTRDHLGSICEVVNNLGSVVARYKYDPYGRRTKTAGTFDADFGYTGHYEHSQSGLTLSLHRPYSSNLGRWLTRDPIGEAGGTNLYAYVSDSPITWTDPLGLIDWGPGTEGARDEMNKTKEGKKTICEVENLEKSTGQKVKVDGGKSEGRYHPDSNQVDLPKNQPLVHTDDPKHKNEQASPGEVANHELDHAKQDLSGKFNDLAKCPDSQYDNALERSAIESENRMRNEQGRSNRTDHWGGPN